MPRALVRNRSLAVVGLALATTGPFALAQVAKEPVPARPRVALTFDDLPSHGLLPPGVKRSDIARSILDALTARGAPPTYGFVNAKGLEDGPDAAEVLRRWRAAGHPLASHTFSHIDLHTNAADAFAQDVLANEATLRQYMGHDGWHWLRYPYLREGDTLEKRRAVQRFLKEKGYRVAQVTMSFHDWAYNDPYARCAARGDQASIALLKQSYRRAIPASITDAQDAARRLYGRDISHVMLLHVGGFTALMMPDLLDALAQRGFEMVTLAEAQSDPAYAEAPDRAFPHGATLLDQVTTARGLPAADGSGGELDRIAALCR
jgi:peptidoglycan/xylan/chitin deacetylase (PgdA/CDA1 family)